MSLFTYHHSDIRENIAIFIDKLGNTICCNCHLLAKSNIWTFIDIIIIFCKYFFSSLKVYSREKGRKRNGRIKTKNFATKIIKLKFGWRGRNLWRRMHTRILPMSVIGIVSLSLRAAASGFESATFLVPLRIS